MDKTKKYQELKLSKYLKDNPLTKGFIISVSILNDKNNYIKDPNELGALYNPKQYQLGRQINSKIYRSKFTKKQYYNLIQTLKIYSYGLCLKYSLKRTIYISIKMR